MAGIYLHIPFCQRRCIYCDFYSTAGLHRQQAYTDALCYELEIRKDDLPSSVIDTVYIGGGTPSLLPVELLSQIFHQLSQIYTLSTATEITLECNPDDISVSWLEQIRELPVNRLSLGIQTFNEEQLSFLRRRHTGQQARQAVALCQKAGFTNISIDLIYGLPGQDPAQWQEDIDRALELQVQHISAYALIYEKGTPLWQLKEQGLIKEVEEETSLTLFNMLIDNLEKGGFEHYEISNFARPGYESRHNSSYWKEAEYIGCGPSAHSFDGKCRRWNTADLSNYIAAMHAIKEGEKPASPWFAYEELNRNEHYNDRIITSLRTCWGLDMHKLHQDFGDTVFQYCRKMAESHLQQGTLQFIPPSVTAPEGILKLTRQGIFVSDNIMSDLLLVDGD